MAIDIKSPQFPESIFEGTLSSWLNKEGQEIKQDDEGTGTLSYQWESSIDGIFSEDVITCSLNPSLSL